MRITSFVGVLKATEYKIYRKRMLLFKSVGNGAEIVIAELLAL